MTRRHAGPIQSNMNGVHRNPSGRPYARLSAIIAAAKAGESKFPAVSREVPARRVSSRGSSGRGRTTLQTHKEEEGAMKMLGPIDEPEVKITPGEAMVRALIDTGKPAYKFQALTGDARSVRSQARDYVKREKLDVTARVIQVGETPGTNVPRDYNLILTSKEMGE